MFWSEQVLRGDCLRANLDKFSALGSSSIFYYLHTVNLGWKGAVKYTRWRMWNEYLAGKQDPQI